MSRFIITQQIKSRHFLVIHLYNCSQVCIIYKVVFQNGFFNRYRYCVPSIVIFDGLNCFLQHHLYRIVSCNILREYQLPAFFDKKCSVCIIDGVCIYCSVLRYHNCPKNHHIIFWCWKHVIRNRIP